MAGTTTNVRKDENVNPKIMVHANGPQNVTLSPPMKKSGSNSVKNLTKLMFKPIANGTKPKTVVAAVNSTGVSLVLDASMMAFLVFNPLAFNSSVNSINIIPFLTTIPAKATIPTPVITIDMD